LFDQQLGPLHGRLGFRRSKPFDMDQRIYQRDLQFALFMA
jgi:hypothetical protein